jgi:hypothetical protein
MTWVIPHFQKNGMEPAMRIGAYVLKFSRDGHSDEIVFLPECSGCGEPITELDQHNLVADYGPLDTRELGAEVPATTVDETLVTKLRCESVDAYHHWCDPNRPDRFTGWTRLACVFKLDQSPVRFDR